MVLVNQEQSQYGELQVFFNISGKLLRTVEEAITVGDFRGWEEKAVSKDNYTVVRLLANLEWKK